MPDLPTSVLLEEVRKKLYGSSQTDISQFRVLWHRQLNTIKDQKIRAAILEASEKHIEDLTTQYKTIYRVMTSNNTPYDLGIIREEAAALLMSTMMLSFMVYESMKKSFSDEGPGTAESMLGGD